MAHSLNWFEIPVTRMKEPPLRRFASFPLLRGGTHPVAGQSPFHGCLGRGHLFLICRGCRIRGVDN